MCIRDTRWRREVYLSLRYRPIFAQFGGNPIASYSWDSVTACVLIKYASIALFSDFRNFKKCGDVNKYLKAMTTAKTSRFPLM